MGCIHQGETMSRLWLFRLFIVSAFVLITAVACGADNGGLEPTATPAGTGVISGHIEIGPLCPVEPCTPQPPGPYDEMKVVLLRDGVVMVEYDLDENGMFSGEAAAGEYRLEVRPCEYMGCSATLPLQVTVRKEVPVTVDIEIDTGIR